jgi:hypothetical protein
MVGVQVAGAGVVGVACAILVEDVVDRIVQSAKAQRRATVLAFRRVIEPDIEDDLDTGSMEGLDRIPELVNGPEWISPGTVGLMSTGPPSGERWRRAAVQALPAVMTRAMRIQPQTEFTSSPGGRRWREPAPQVRVGCGP